MVRGNLVLAVNDDMEPSELTSAMCESVDVPDAYRSHSAHYSPDHGLAPSPPPRPASRAPSPSLPKIPAADLDLTFSFDSIMGTSSQAEPQ